MNSMNGILNKSFYSNFTITSRVKVIIMHLLIYVYLLTLSTLTFAFSIRLYWSNESSFSSSLQCATQVLNKKNYTYWIDYYTLLGAIKAYQVPIWDSSLSISIFIPHNASHKEENISVTRGYLEHMRNNFQWIKLKLMRKCNFTTSLDTNIKESTLHLVNRYINVKLSLWFMNGLTVKQLKMNAYRAIEGILNRYMYVNKTPDNKQVNNNTGFPTNITYNSRNYADVFPLKHCKLNHIETYCPYKSESILDEWFGTINWRKESFKNLFMSIKAF